MEKEMAIMWFYNPHKDQISKHLKEIRRNKDAFSSNYINLVLLRDFNVESAEKHMKDFSLILQKYHKGWKYYLIRVIWISQNVFNSIESFLHPTKTTYYSISKFSNEAFIHDQIHFFNSALVEKTVLLENSVALKKQAPSKKNILD